MSPMTQRRSDPMREERQGPFTATGFFIMLVAVGAAVLVTVVLRKPSPIAVLTEANAPEPSLARSAAELTAPTVLMPEEVIVSVPVREGGELRPVVLRIAVKLGKGETRGDKEVNPSHLEKVYVPKVKALMPKVRHLLIRMTGNQSVQQLRDPGTQDKILNALKDEINGILHSHGLERRVSEVYWHCFHFD